MEIALVIVGGIVLLCAVAVVGDYLTKTKLARLTSDPAALKKLEQRIEELERRNQDQEAKIALLENDVSFTSKLLQDQSRK